MTAFSPANSSHAKGFSLVEVTLAIGITAVALVSLMGMLPKGLQTMQRAADMAVMGRIHQQILGEIQLTPWESDASGADVIDSFDGQVRFYDDQGIEIPDSDKGEFNHVYTARVSLPRKGSQMPTSVGAGTYGGVILPGGEDASGSYSGLDSEEVARMVVVEITAIASPDFLNNPRNGFDNPDNSKSIFSFRTAIAKTGREFQK